MEPVKNKWLGRLSALAIVVVAIMLVVALWALRPEPPKKEIPISLPLVEVQEMLPTRTQMSISSQGAVTAKNETTLVAEVSGVVRSIAKAFVAGGTFKEGDVLLRIDPRDYEVSVQQSKAALANAKAKLTEELARAEVARREWDGLYKEGKSPTDLALRIPFVDQAKASVDSAKADLAASERRLERTVIRAPYDGMVKERKVDLGQYLNIGTPMGLVFSTEVAEIRLAIPDTDIAHLMSNRPRFAPGQSVVLSATYSGIEVDWLATIVRSEGVVDPRNRMHYLVAEVDDPYRLKPKAEGSPLKIGTFVQARIAGNEVDNVIRVPRRLLRNQNDLVVVDKDNALQFRQIDVLRTDAQYVYFINGTQAGDRALLTAIETPVSGTKVRVRGDEETPAIAPEKASDKALNSDKISAKESSAKNDAKEAQS